MKLGLALFFTLLSILVSGQCTAQCSNVVQNGDFESGWNNWTRGSGWGRSTNYGSGNSTFSVNNQLDNSSGSDLTQSVTGLSGSTTLQLSLDAYPQSPNTGTSHLDIFLGSTRYARLTNANGGSAATITLYNSAVGVSVSSWSYSTWKKGIRINIPWNGTTNTATLKFTFISSSSLRDWGIDNISIVPLVAPSVTILGNPSATRKTVIQFTASPTNGGATPTYRWFKDGVFKGTGTTWIDSAWEKGTDTIRVRMASSLACRTLDTVENTFLLTVLSLQEVKYFQHLDSIHFQFIKNKEDLVEVYGFDHVTGKATWITTTDEMVLTLPAKWKYYYINSGIYKKYIGPFDLISDDPRKVLSTKQLLGQFTN